MTTPRTPGPRRDGVVQRPLRRRLRVPRRARSAPRQHVRALPQHRAHRGSLRVRQRAAAVRVPARDRQHCVLRGDGTDDEAAHAARGAVRRARRSPARQPARHDRSDHGRPADREHHLQRRPRRDARSVVPLPPLDRDHVRAARTARRAAGEVPRRLPRPRHRPAAGHHRVRPPARCSTSAGCHRREGVRGRRRRRVLDVAGHHGQRARRQGRHGRPGRSQGPAPALRVALARHRSRDRGRSASRRPAPAARNSTTSGERRSGNDRSTHRRPGSPGRRRCATKPTTRATSSVTCGPASGGPVRAPARPSSAIPNRFSARSASWPMPGSTRSSCRDTRTLPSATCSPATCCRTSITVGWSSAPIQ